MSIFPGEQDVGVLYLLPRNEFVDEQRDLVNRLEKLYNYSWDDLHGYRQRFSFPSIPHSMDPSKILNSTKMDLCYGQYDGIHKCLQVHIGKEEAQYPHHRLRECQNHHILYSRCVSERDRKILVKSKKYEENLLKRMDEKDRKKYILNLEHSQDYNLYVAGRQTDSQKKRFYEKDAICIYERRKNILKKFNMKDDLKILKKPDTEHIIDYDLRINPTRYRDMAHHK